MATTVPKPQQVTTTCPGCHSQQQVPIGVKRIICQSCGKPVVFRRCDTVGKVFPVLDEWTSWTHPGCATKHLVHPSFKERAIEGWKAGVAKNAAKKADVAKNAAKLARAPAGELYVPKPDIGSPGVGQFARTCGRCGYHFITPNPEFTIVDLERCRSCGALWGALTGPTSSSPTPNTFRLTCAHCGNQNPGGIPWVNFYTWTDFRPTRRWNGTHGPAVPVDAVCPRCERSIFCAYPSQVLDCPGCGKPFPVETIVSYTGKNRRRGTRRSGEYWEWESVPETRMVNSGPLSYRCPDCKTKVPHSHGRPRPPAEAKPRSYVQRCLEPAFAEGEEPRDWRSEPSFRSVIDALDAGDLTTAAQQAEKFAAQFPDLDLPYDWWADALLRQRKLDEARDVCRRGLERSKRKYMLCVLLGKVSWEAGVLADAVYWWAQAIHCQESLRHRTGEYSSYLHLYYVANGAEELEVARAFRQRVDSISGGMIRLDPAPAQSLMGLASRQTTPDIREVLMALRARYLQPQGTPPTT